MINKKCISALAALTFAAGLCFANEIVLQNGKDGYGGCIDTYLFSIGNGTQFEFKHQSENFHTAINTMTAC